ncbi:MAG TPA: hypothetical protein VK638_13200 [Edaphobacter sp.]|nr:hypothetical protein [Edaphobacter sp.]
MLGAEEVASLTDIPNIPQKGTRLGNWLTHEQAKVDTLDVLPANHPQRTALIRYCRDWWRAWRSIRTRRRVFGSR